MATPRKANTTRRPATRRTATVRRKQPAGHATLPNWLRNSLAVLVVLVFSAGFYYFFILPYAYRWKPCAGRRGYSVCIPRGYQVHGIDISRHQGQIDWEELIHHRQSKYPLYFVFMKATEGGDFPDVNFRENFHNARRYGFVRGAYHFFSPKTDPVKQADFFIQTVDLQSGDLPPVLDIEVIGDRTPKELQQAAITWLDKVEGHYGVKPIIYTSYKFKTSYLNDSVFNTYPFWIAHYHVDTLRYEGHWDFWQHSDGARMKGIPRNVDLNVYRGTPDELRQLTIP